MTSSLSLLLLVAAAVAACILLPTPAASRRLQAKRRTSAGEDKLLPLADYPADPAADHAGLCSKCSAALTSVEEDQKRLVALMGSLRSNAVEGPGHGGVCSETKDLRDGMDVLRSGLSRVNQDLQHMRYASRRSESGLDFLRSDVAFLQSSLDSAAEDLRWVKSRVFHDQGATCGNVTSVPLPSQNASSCSDVTFAVDRSSRDVRLLTRDVVTVRKSVDVITNGVAQIQETLSRTNEDVEDVKKDLRQLFSRWNSPLRDQDSLSLRQSRSTVDQQQQQHNHHQQQQHQQQMQQQTKMLEDGMNLMKKSFTTALFDLNRLKSGVRKSRKELGSIKLDVSFLRGFFQRGAPEEAATSQKLTRHQTAIKATKSSNFTAQNVSGESDLFATLTEVRKGFQGVHTSVSNNFTLVQHLLNKTEVKFQNAIRELEMHMDTKLDKVMKKMDDMDKETNRKLDRILSLMASLSAETGASKMAELKQPVEGKARDQAIEKSTANITLKDDNMDATKDKTTKSRTRAEVLSNVTQVASCQNSDSENSTEEGTLRLASQGMETETSAPVGRLELFSQGEWKTLCGVTFDPRAARVACRDLGLPTEFPQPIRGSGFFAAERNATQVNCTGEEARLKDCQLSEGPCPSLWDAWVGCRSGPWVRLRGSKDPHQGRVEVLHGGQWGTVCDDGFSTREATVVCSTLGYSGKKVKVHGKARYGPGRGPIWMTEVRCPPWAQALEECGHKGWGAESCTHLEDVGVECTP